MTTVDLSWKLRAQKAEAALRAAQAMVEELRTQLDAAKSAEKGSAN